MFGTFSWFVQFSYCYLNQEVFKPLIFGTENANFVTVLDLILFP